jgi:hypothetical protein
VGKDSPSPLDLIDRVLGILSILAAIEVIFELAEPNTTSLLNKHNFIFLSFNLILISSLISKFIRREIIINKLLYSFIMKFSYSLALCLIGGSIVYTAYFVFALNIKWSFLALITYLILEIRLLFFEDAFHELPSFTSLRSLPTPGIFIAAPIAYILISIRERDLDWLTNPRCFNIWALVRYYVINPYWLSFETKDRSFYGGLKVSNDFAYITFWPYITKWTGSPIAAEFRN